MTTTAPQRDTAQAPYTRRTSLFRPTSIDECPNWRYLIAHHVANEAEDQPPQHPDPCINDTAELIYVGLHKVPDFTGTLRQWYIRDALMLWQHRPMVVKVLESYLAGGFTSDDIVSRCNIKRDMLEAYAAVLCDVDDHRRRQSWAGLQMNPLNRGRGQVGAIASVLQSTFFSALPRA